MASAREPSAGCREGRAGGSILQAVGFVRRESCPTQSVLPLVGLAAEKVIRDRYSCQTNKPPARGQRGRTEVPLYNCCVSRIP
ncbi:MAG: hypothetical protein R6U98_21310 [Pirellulaceae bacterium]